MDAVIFGEYFRELRLRQGLTLRAYCAESGEDPGNISRIERGVKEPPKEKAVLNRLASSLGLREDSDEWNEFHRLAAIAAGRIPDDVIKNGELVKRLPVFFRTLTGERFSDEKLKEFVEYLRKTHGQGGD